jgi:hypothetical protein
MLELLFLLGLVAVLVGLGLILKAVFGLVFAFLFLPFKILGWVLGGVFRLLLLPFQIVGGLILGLIFLPLLLVGVPVLLGIGVPLLVAGVLFFGFWLVIGAVCLAGSLMFGWC